MRFWNCRPRAGDPSDHLWFFLKFRIERSQVCSPSFEKKQPGISPLSRWLLTQTQQRPWLGQDEYVHLQDFAFSSFRHSMTGLISD
jgi:hypothetical protein